jgi:RHH-type rel operon transcriptional repressor/antitoxin RelB
MLTAETAIVENWIGHFMGVGAEMPWHHSRAHVGIRDLESASDTRYRSILCTFNHFELKMSTTMTVRLEDDVKDRLDVLAEATQRSKSFLAAEAIRAYVENNEWQIGEIQAALKEAEADAGDFASDNEVAALAKKWKVNAG